MRISFELEDNGNWYVVLPEWKGLHAQLQMVAGADTFLDMISKGRRLVTLSVENEHAEGYDLIEKLCDKFYGADYYIESFQGKKIYHKFWLCPVVVFVLGEYPDKLYIKQEE